MADKQKIKFFIPMKKIPTITHQQKKIRIVNNKPIVYEPAKLKDTRALFMSKLHVYAPKKFLSSPIRLTTQWLFTAKNKAQIGQYKITRPDTDNLQKLFKDCMTDVGFWKDDAVVASEIVEKLYNDITGIFVKIEEL